MNFVCNICGVTNPLDVSNLHRELVPCSDCGSNARFRGIYHAIELSVIKDDDEVKDRRRLKRTIGLGFSDAPIYASKLAKLFSYTNTFYHQPPRVDIMTRSSFPNKKFDFVVCSDVMEHVVGDLDEAFGNLKRALNPEGVLIFSVPYLEGEETIEHFPQLHQWKITEIDGKFFLNNVRRDGAHEAFTNLHFHGGPGEVLEMRVFGEGDLMQRLRRAGFQRIDTLEANLTQIGYAWPYVVHREDHQGRRMKGCVLICS